MKALVGAFNQEKVLVGAFSVIVKTGCGTDGSICGTSRSGEHCYRCCCPQCLCLCPPISPISAATTRPDTNYQPWITQQSLSRSQNLYSSPIFMARKYSAIWKSFNKSMPPTNTQKTFKIYNILSQPPVVCSQNTIKNWAQTDGILFTEKLIVLSIWVGNRYSENTEHMPGNVTGVKCWVYLVSACRVQDVQR